MTASEAGEHLAIAKAKIAEGPVKADVATAWAVIGILEALLEPQRSESPHEDHVHTSWFPEAREQGERNQVQELEKLVQQWKDRCLEAERVRDAHYHSWRNAVAREQDWKRRNRELNESAGKLSERISELERQVELVARQRDTEAKNAMTLVRQLQEAQRDLATQDTQIHELQLQVANQADTIQKLTRRAEA